MDKKKILIVSRSFYPMNSPRSFRTTELAKEFARQGNEVTVLTPRIEEVHDKFEKKYGLNIWDLGQPKWKSIEIKGKGIERLIRRALRRFPSLLFEYPNIELIGMVASKLKEANGYDMLISIAVPYPVHWGVARIWNSNSQNNPAKMWIADCGDPYVGQENDSFRVPFYFYWVEKWFMRKTDYITVPVESAIPAYFGEFHEKMRVIPQGFDFDDIPDCVSKGKVNDPISFAYAGGLIPGRRDPIDFFEYLIESEVDFRFDLYTGQKGMVKSFVKRSNGRIRLCDLLPRNELLENLCQYDFLVNFENVGKKQIPSKLIDYALLHKPILSVSSSDFDPDPVDAFLHRDYKNAYQVEDLDNYNIKTVAQKFSSLCE